MRLPSRFQNASWGSRAGVDAGGLLAQRQLGKIGLLAVERQLQTTERDKSANYQRGDLESSRRL